MVCGLTYRRGPTNAPVSVQPAIPDLCDAHAEDEEGKQALLATRLIDRSIKREGAL